MSKIKVSEATNVALDWLVAKCQGHEPHVFTERDCGQGTLRQLGRWCGIDVSPAGHTVFAPSTDPAQGHPIIEREGIGFFCNRTSEIGSRFKPDAGADWRAFSFNKHGTHFFGPTALIAAMRCYVASKLGDEVEIPEELL